MEAMTARLREIRVNSVYLKTPFWGGYSSINSFLVVDRGFSKIYFGIFTRLPLPIITLRIKLTTVITIEPKTAVRKLLTSNPSTSLETIHRKNPFITNVKRPRLRMFRGRVMKSIMGLIKAFTIPRMREAMSTEVQESVDIPLKRRTTTIIETDVTPHRTRKTFMANSLEKNYQFGIRNPPQI
jgi:hypothetical protein